MKSIYLLLSALLFVSFLHAQQPDSSQQRDSSRQFDNSKRFDSSRQTDGNKQFDSSRHPADSSRLHSGNRNGGGDRSAGSGNWNGGGTGRPPGGGNRNGGGGATNGHFYGKIVDSKTNKGLNGATVQLIRQAKDSSGARRDVPVGTGFAEANGDFSFENISTRGQLTLRVTNIGYTDFSQPVNFDPGSADKDLGNIKVVQSETTLTGVTVTTSAKPFFEMGVDRKVFNVDKNIVTTGQTATEVMKQIPSLNVDVDGNVTLRNAAPTLFIDGRPTTLTLDQIPADIIDKVELVTNPSAKYDASGGNAGILNIVLKKNKKTGYNGNIRAGVDTRGRVNSGVDLSLRQNKFNYSLSANVNQRKSRYTNLIDRNNFTDGMASEIHQFSKGTQPGNVRLLPRRH